MTETISNAAGDFVRVATCATPTEAHLLKGVLESAGLNPRVADANTVQANTWMTQAVGGVRVLVPESQAEAARVAIEEFNAGAYELDGETTSAPSHAEIPQAVFSPDRAVLLGFLLTPAFGAALQLANTYILGIPANRIALWLSTTILGAASIATTVFVHTISSGPFAAFRASFGLSFLTIVWYFALGQNQSRAFLAKYGPKYKRRGLFKIALIAGAALFAFGWALDAIA